MYGVEQRQQERYELSAPVHLKKHDGTEHITAGIITKDISSKGVYLQSENMTLLPGEKVHLEVTLTIDKLRELFDCSDRIILKVKGSVVRSADLGMAIEFDKKYSIFPEVLRTN